MNEAVTSVCVPAQADRLHLLRGIVREGADALGFGTETAQNLVLAVNEACMNVIQHGYGDCAGTIELEVRALDDAIEFRIRDFAPSVDLAVWQARDLTDIRPGGLGVHFIREIMDEVAYLPPPDGSGNLLSLKKYRKEGSGQ